MAARATANWLPADSSLRDIADPGLYYGTDLRDRGAKLEKFLRTDRGILWRDGAHGDSLRAEAELTALASVSKIEKLEICRGSSLVERRPEKEGVASSILAPGTTRSRHRFVPEEIYFAVSKMRRFPYVNSPFSNAPASECTRARRGILRPSGVRA